MMPLQAYNEKDEYDAVQHRYERILRAIPFTLERLKQASTFLAVVKQLRSEGWKDWHILLAIVNGVMNWHLNQERSLTGVEQAKEAGEKLFRKMSEQAESPNDTPIPIDYFTIERMNEWLDLSMTSTLEQRGAIFRSRGYDPKILRKIVGKRYHYFELDVPHDPIFADAV